MTSVLGTLIRVARSAVGLGQAELARAMGVGQQTVSAWERGRSRPRQAQLPALCSVLSLSLDEVTIAGNYHDPAIATQNLVLALPFENLSDEAFEAFTRDLGARIYPGRTATRNGSSGHKQFGVDVFIDGDGERVGVQCKRHKTFGPEDIRAAIGEVTGEAQITSGIIALSRKTATPAARKEIHNHPDWKLWDGEDLSALVRGLPRSDALVLVDTYFRGMREPFLGVREPSPWLTPDEYDSALAGRLGVDRNFELVGRDAELSRIVGLSVALEERVILIGRGGIGKSRLLRAFARSDVGRTVVFASRGAIAPESYEALPEGAPIVVVDDAMDPEFDLRALELGIRRMRPDATLVMSTRPRALAQLQAALEISDLESAKISVTLDDLSLDAAESLAREALGTSATETRVNGLAHVGYDCPFMIVLGAHLMREGVLTDTDLVTQTELRQQILTRFADVVVRGSNEDARISVLQAVAAIQPANLGESEFLDVIAGVSDNDEATVLDVLDELEDLGLVLRRGQSVRVVPDLLGDAILERALVSKSGIDKRFALRLADQTRGRALSHALRNVSVIDWQRRTQGPSDLADTLWSALAEHALTLANSDRIALAKRVAPVAGIYPGRALDLAELLLANPGPDEEDPLSGIWGPPRTFTATEVGRAFAPLISNAGNNLEFLPRSMRKLLEIGGTDTRQENQNPEHGMRLLRELGQFHPRRLIRFNRVYVETVADLLADPTLEVYSPQLVSLLVEVMAHDIIVTESRGWNLSIARHDIDLDVVSGVRAAAITIAITALGRDDRTALAAIEVLEQGLSAKNRADDVTDEFTTIVAALRAVLSDASRPAGIRLAAYRSLSWHATYGEGPRRLAARAARAALASDDELLLARLTRGGFHTDEDYDDERVTVETSSDATDSPAVARFHRAAAQLSEATQDLCRRWISTLSPEQILTRLRAAIDDALRERDRFTPPRQLLQILFLANSDLTRVALAPRTVATPADDCIVEAALGVCFASDYPDLMSIATDKIGQGEPSASMLASAVGGVQGALSVVQAGVVRALLTTPHPAVYSSLLSTARWRESLDPDLVLDILQASPIETNSVVAAAAATVLSGSATVPWASLSREERARFLDRFTQTPSLDAHVFGELVAQQIAIDSQEALTFLQRRIDQQSEADDDYDALPYLDAMPFSFRASQDLPALIATHVDWLLEDAPYRRGHDGLDVLQRMFADYEDDQLAVLLSLIKTQQQERIALVRSILNGAPHDLVLRAPTFVAEAIEAASALSSPLERDVILGLHGSAEYGSYSRSIGADDPEELALKVGAELLALKFDTGSAMRRFYDDVATRAAARIESERQDDASLRIPRRW
ncbi:helix-turn-helix domain-containing protein [Leucobacter allii]|uniref:Helix-turn-helix domain-containing protein n=1 Tax=Leucobacter allii TaxID=2932247 RepID=A0ABY4FR57_9MICO|nr:helix-turn-helix domain-containing protein [Leucobacter allii]UOQ58768.1 helix-turn-helix domain-containing protein [Leucobacter allii]